MPLRCPCLANCSRYRYTALTMAQTCAPLKWTDPERNMKGMGIMAEYESLKKMLTAGEPTTFAGGNRNLFINNACPEFFLHGHEYRLLGMPNVATHQFSYDEDFIGSKFRAGESRH